MRRIGKLTGQILAQNAGRDFADDRLCHSDIDDFDEGVRGIERKAEQTTTLVRPGERAALI